MAGRLWVHAVPLALFACGALTWFGGAPEVPHDYNGDSVWHAAVFKAIADGGWAPHMARLGAPFGASHWDFPTADLGFHLVAWVIARFTSDAGLIFNCLYALGFPLAYLAAYFVLRRLGVGRTLAAFGGLAFAILPYHFARTGHLFLATYFIVPAIVWLCFELWVGDDAPTLQWARSNKASLAVAALAGAFGVYYAFFAAMLFCLTGVVVALRRRSIRPVLASGILVAATSVVVAATVAPSLAYRAEYGANRDISAPRNAGHSQVLGLNLALTLLPHDDHRLATFDRIGKAARATTPLLNENQYGYIGLIASLGTLILLLHSLGATIRAPGPDALGALACASLGCIVYGIVGGFGYVFALLVSPEIRGLNRISVFLGFTGIAAFVVVLDGWLNRRVPSHKRALATTLLAVALLALALLDQVPKSLPPERSVIIEKFRQDRAFVSRIEASVPPGSRILQLPYVEYPEQPPRHLEAAYAQMRPYLHSSSLSWSYGAMRARSHDAWIRKLSGLPARQLPGAAADSGFGGIYLEGDAMPDGGAALRSEISAALAREWISSASGRQFFIPVEPRGGQPVELDVVPSVGGGFHAWEESGPNRWAWSSGHGVLQILNVRKVPKTISLELELVALSDRAVSISLNGAPETSFPASAGAPSMVRLPALPLRPGENALRFRSDGEARTPGTGDPRVLSFAVRNPRLIDTR